MDADWDTVLQFVADPLDPDYSQQPQQNHPHLTRPALPTPPVRPASQVSVCNP